MSIPSALLLFAKMGGMRSMRQVGEEVDFAGFASSESLNLLSYAVARCYVERKAPLCDAVL